MNRILSPTAIVIALAAITISITDRQISQPLEPSRDPSPLKAQRERLAQLEGDLEQAIATIAVLRAQLAELDSKPAQSAAPTALNTALVQRVAALEQQSQQLAKFTNEFDQYGVVSSLEAELVDAYATLMDTNRSPGERLQQVGSLKRYRYFDDKALQAVSDIYLQTTNFGQKGRALAALEGTIPSPEFRNQILADLSAEAEQGNQSARFRYYAIEALEPVGGDPAVREWLNHLARNDPEAKLASRAREVLEKNSATSDR